MTHCILVEKGELEASNVPQNTRIHREAVLHEPRVEQGEPRYVEFNVSNGIASQLTIG
jgi:hypothetical protein